MIKKETKLKGVYEIIPTVSEDYRGSFTETYNKENYLKNGLAAEFVQDDISISYRNVLRGLHGDGDTYKLVSCIYGRIYLVVLNYDLESEQYGRWQSFILSEENKKQIYIPPNFANGYYVLSGQAIFSYKQSTYYSGENQFSCKWNDPRFQIEWPCEHPCLSKRDK